jgi:phosphopantothenoylcysteine decarboxylase / phosphopantothenate---cysteine ligase
MRVLLGITGGIAAYKAAEIIRSLTESGHEVRVVPTQNALRFIGATTLEALSHNVVDPDLYTDVESVKHIELAQWADVLLVAPATASFLARTASGIADDLLGNLVLATNARVIVAPAMHTEMWFNPATSANVKTLRDRGVEVVEPGVGRLTGSDTGVGRLPDTEVIVAALSRGLKLAGKKVLVTAGGTREPIDPVRFIGNYSSGKQGIAIALAAQKAGADVTLIACNIDQAPRGFKVIKVQTAVELKTAIDGETADVLVMAAAVADFRVAEPSDQKLKKAQLGDHLSLELVANPDILAGIDTPGLFKVGFAAETSGELLAVAKEKLTAKGCQLLVANDVSDGAVFGQDDNKVLIVDAQGVVAELAATKAQIATELIDIIASRLG